MATVTTSGQNGAARRREPLQMAYAGLLVFTVVYCARPQDWIPGIGTFPVGKLTGGLALLALLIGLGLQSRRVPALPGEIKLLVLLVIQFGVSALLSPVWRGGAFDAGVTQFSKIVLIAIALVLTVSSLDRLRRLIFVQSAAVAAVAMAALWENIRIGHGAKRLVGVLGGIYENPNDLALAIGLAIPFCLAFVLSSRKVWLKAVWSLAILLMCYAVLSTYSRGGLLTLIVACAFSLWEFGVKGRRHGLVLIAMVGVIAIVLSAAPTGYGQRIATIFDPDSDPTGSAQARRELLYRSLSVTAEHPLFGVGVGNFEVISGTWQVSHNSYTQLSSEGGIPALVLFILLIGKAFANVRAAKSVAGPHPDLSIFAGAIRVSLLAFLVGAFFASVPYHFFPYFLIAYSSALVRIASVVSIRDQGAMGQQEVPLVLGTVISDSNPSLSKGSAKA